MINDDIRHVLINIKSKVDVNKPSTIARHEVRPHGSPPPPKPRRRGLPPDVLDGDQSLRIAIFQIPRSLLRPFKISNLPGPTVTASPLLKTLAYYGRQVRPIVPMLDLDISRGRTTSRTPQTTSKSIYMIRDTDTMRILGSCVVVDLPESVACPGDQTVSVVPPSIV
ncbi:hypothetical protein BD779DRAFT_1575434 [Infundibulicybe gibba]|nr:hypothetical protein BD779DRAFT_1575434 [Infundibulicybe gibba]